VLIVELPAAAPEIKRSAALRSIIPQHLQSPGRVRDQISVQLNLSRFRRCWFLRVNTGPKVAVPSLAHRKIEIFRVANSRTSFCAFGRVRQVRWTDLSTLTPYFLVSFRPVFEQVLRAGSVTITAVAVVLPIQFPILISDVLRGSVLQRTLSSGCWVSCTSKSPMLARPTMSDSQAVTIRPHILSISPGNFVALLVQPVRRS